MSHSDWGGKMAGDPPWPTDPDRLVTNGASSR